MDNKSTQYNPGSLLVEKIATDPNHTNTEHMLTILGMYLGKAGEFKNGGFENVSYGICE